MTRSASYLSPQQMFALDLACHPICQAFGRPPYLVGSVTERPDFRDVDVRMMLPDEVHASQPHDVWTFLGFAVSAYLRDSTGLPVDFQFQQASKANELHSKPRNPLGLRHLCDFTGDAKP